MHACTCAYNGLVCMPKLRHSSPRSLRAPYFCVCVVTVQVSGKAWKEAPTKRSSAAKNAIVGSSWEKKMRDKALAKALAEQKAAAVEAIKEKRKVCAWCCVCTTT